MRRLRFPRGLLDPNAPVERALLCIPSPGRRLWALGLSGRTNDDTAVADTMTTLRDRQDDSGCWSSRHGDRAVLETAVALLGLASVRENMRRPYVRLAVDWLVAAQHEDGGFGVDPHADSDVETAGVVLLALLEAGEGRSLAAHDVAAWLSKGLERSDETCADSLEILALGRYCRANRDRWERW